MDGKTQRQQLLYIILHILEFQSLVMVLFKVKV
jgi:hypothetical protein